MSIYDVTKYNEGIYGVDEDTTTLIWVVQIAWEGVYAGGGGIYSGYNEAMNASDLSVRRGRSTWVTDTGFAPFDEGEAVITVMNDDGRYSPLNASSPLYPNVRPGPFASISVVDGRGGTEYPVMRGYLDDIQNYTQKGKRYAKLIVKGGMDWLQNRTVSVDYPAADTTLDNLHTILTAANWNFVEWPEYPGSDPGLTLGAGSFRNISALVELRNVCMALPGTLFLNNDGNVVLWGAYWDGTVYPTSITEDVTLRDVSILQPWKSMRNKIEAGCYEMVSTVAAPGFVLWTLVNIPTVFATGLTLGYYAPTTFFTEFVYTGYEEVSPTAGSVVFEWSVNSNPDGTGTNMKNHCSIAYGPNNEWVQLTNLNPAGMAIYLTLMRATTDLSVLVSSATPAIYSGADANDYISQAAYGIKKMTWDTKRLHIKGVEQAIALWLQENLGGLQVELEVEIEGRNVLQFGPDLYYYIMTVALPTLGISREFTIDRIEHKWLSETGQAVRTTYKLVPYLDKLVW
jgi:hypothetical protein